MPKIQTDLGKEIHFVKLPNFLSVESRPFDGETYEDEMDDEATQQDEEGRTRLKLKVENTIRWRQGFDKEGGWKEIVKIVKVEENVQKTNCEILAFQATPSKSRTLAL